MRVDRHFAFVDLSGFTSYTDRYGDQRAVEILTAFRAVVRRVATDFGVRIAKWLGDGCMIVAVDARELMGAMVELIEQTRTLGLPLELHAGLAGGQVILLEGDDYIGGAVNLASRLCDAASPDQILVTPEMAGVAPARALFEADRSLLIPGFTHSVAVCRLGSNAPGLVATPSRETRVRA
jgi:class 3 adenylate cyclase